MTDPREPYSVALDLRGLPLLRQLDVDLANRLAPDHADHRDPYVGNGADGARRSAQIDREEADCLDRGTPRYDLLLSSAAAWDRQADELEEEAAEPGVLEAWMADGSHDPATCAAGPERPGDCGYVWEHHIHDTPSCGCGGDHWSCPGPDALPEEPTDA